MVQTAQVFFFCPSAVSASDVLLTLLMIILESHYLKLTDMSAGTTTKIYTTRTLHNQQ